MKYLRISLGTECNRRCWYCFREGIRHEAPALLDVEGIAWLLRLLTTEMGLEQVRFTGGEPLLNPCVDSMVAAAVGAGLENVGLTTNGSFLLQRLDSLAAAGLTSVAVHVNCQEESVRSPEEAIASDIQLMCAARQKIPEVRANVVINRREVDTVKQTLDACSRSGIDVLLLDLIAFAGADPGRLRGEYVGVQEAEDILGLLENRTRQDQASNVTWYEGGSSRIKFVRRYTDATMSTTACTKRLAWHPLLLTPDMRLVWCNHFGAGSVAVGTEVATRSARGAIQRVEDALRGLALCGECLRAEELQEA